MNKTSLKNKTILLSEKNNLPVLTMFLSKIKINSKNNTSFNSFYKIL